MTCAFSSGEWNFQWWWDRISCGESALLLLYEDSLYTTATSHFTICKCHCGPHDDRNIAIAHRAGWKPALYVLRCTVFFCHLSLPLKRALCYVIASSTNENDLCQHNGVSHTNNMTWAWAETWCSQSLCCPDHYSQTLKVDDSCLLQLTL